jgi:phosphate starvation-inducible PhoH-like protein
VTRVLDQIDDIHFARLTSADVVRHTLVGQIVDAYTRFDAERQVARFERQGPTGAEPLNRAERRGNNPADHQRSTRPDKRWGR